MLGAAVLHASWNAMAKGGAGDALIRSALIAVGAAVTGLPFLLVTGLADGAAWPYVLASAAIHVLYFILVGLAYRDADYSAVYPLVRGGAPLFTALIAAWLLGEVLRPLAWAGVALLCSGIVGLGADAIFRGNLNRRSLGIAALTAGVIVTYTLVDGVGARVSGDAAAYVLTMLALTGALMVPVALGWRGERLAGLLSASWRNSLAAGFMVNLSYGIALWAMTKAPIGLVGALRETSVLFATLIAALFLRERFGAARWIGAAAIVGGLALIQTA